MSSPSGAGGDVALPSTAPTTADRSPPSTNVEPAADTATTPAKPSSSASPEVLMLDDDEEEGSDDQDGAGEAHEDASSSSSEEDDTEKDADYKGAGKAAAAKTKRKATTSASSTPAAKKAKTSSGSAATKATSKGPEKGKGKEKENKVEKPLVEIKKGKFEVRQKPLKTDFAQSYTTELHAFVAWAVGRIKDDDFKEVSEYQEHHGFFAKLVHESSQTLSGLSSSVKNTLKTAIAAGLAATFENSQEAEEQEWDEAKVSEKLPIQPIRSLIQSLATRTNYGLSDSDLPSDDTPSSGPSSEAEKVETKPATKAIPAGLQIWCWEVEDRKLWVQEFAPRLEKRKAERQEIRRAALELFQSLPTSEQRDLLDGKVTATGKAKTKAKASGDGDGDADAAGAAGDKTASGSKGKGKKKELTEEEKKAAEEKAAAKAAREAEKEAKRKEREEKRAVKAEKDAAELTKKEEKARIKAERQAEEDKKSQLARKQKNMFSSFFVKKSASPSPDAGPSESSPAKPSTSDFDRVFHPFTIRERVELAPVNRFYKPSAAYRVELDSQPDLTLRDSLKAFLSTASKRRIPPYNPYPEPPLSVRQTVNAISDATLTSQDVSELYNALKDPKKVRIKTLKFKEDYRPGYVGTWTKRSVMVGPRTPFARDNAILNYDHDSEAEWEEEGDDPEAEELASDGGERSGDEKEEVESDADSWLAEDDEIEYQDGYEADGDVVMQAAENGGRGPGRSGDDDVVVVQSDKAKKHKEREHKKRRADRERKRRKDLVLPVAKGPIWQDDPEEVVEAAFKTMRIQLLNDAPFGLNPFAFVSKPFVAVATGSAGASAGKENVAIGGVGKSDAGKLTVPTLSAGSVNTLKPKRGPPKKPFPPEQLPALLKMLHGSQKTKPVIVNDFFELMKAQSTPVAKVAVEAKLKEIAFTKVKNTNIVAPDLLAQHGIPH
ncbi:hypothetical protein JCM8202_003659 [Rhodotorula sphaerocarpa]